VGRAPDAALECPLFSSSGNRSLDALNAADWTIITIIGISMVLSVLRGFVREAMSLVGWVLAFFVAMLFSDRFAFLLTTSIQDETGRHVVAFASLFVLTLIAVALLARLLQSLIAFAGLSFVDRLLGIGFGFARGVFLLLAAVVMLRPLLQPERFGWWQQSLLLPHLLLMEGWFRSVTGAASGMLSGIGN
jgi:membrane protein required for colicin V production